ncbi:DUF6249 domain-containing protein [Phenylobacterium soli]|uniref:DUF6249 domain-containing protein n=1 Tax=Phenylobacterium soli TaxID=2170551 RepID=A0A328ARF5_9CAUL|nr:DUF6249 domain-containing protein [Phenylobacterium soli]RAK56326.1 hypothetical protein DJ017_11885 [Phenylobacterium soli]
MVPIFFFAMIAAIVIVPRYFKSLERQKMADTLKAAIEKGQPLPTEVMDAISSGVKAPPSPQRDLRTGIVWLGVGIGLAGMGLALGFEEPDATFPLIGIACFPAFIGLAFIAMFFLNRGRR